MSIDIYEVVKEYVLTVEGLEHSVKGRISRLRKDVGVEEYYWDISHHYRPSKEHAGVYYPSGKTTNSFEDAENHLLSYIHNFTTIDVTPNNLY